MKDEENKTNADNAQKTWCVMDDSGCCMLSGLTKREAVHAANILSEEHPDENWDVIEEKERARGSDSMRTQ